MPWSVRKSRDGRFCVVKKTDNAIVACHETRADADAQVRALYAAEPSAGLVDARELNLLAEFVRERDVNLPGGGHNLRNYWVRGEGAVKIGWGTDGSMARCITQLGKYVKDPGGLCAEYHHAATGEWPRGGLIPSSGAVVELRDELTELVSEITTASVSAREETAVQQLATSESDTADTNLDTPDAGDLNAAARRIAAERGWAMADGSYPIRDEEHHGLVDLDKAIRAVGRGGAPHDKIRRHIMKRARALDAYDRIPGNWSTTGKREEAVAATEEFHAGDSEAHRLSHGNWTEKISGLTSEDVAKTVKSLGSGGKPSSSRKINPRTGSDAYERALEQRTSNYYDEDDEDEREADRRRTAGFSVDDTLTAAARKKCAPGQHKMPDGTCMDDEEMQKSEDMPMKPMMKPDTVTEYADEPWEGVLVVEGLESGDGRLFALGSLDWAGLPMPLQFQPANNGGHTGSVTVGEIDHAVRRGSQIYGRGKVYGTALAGEHGDGVRTAMRVGGVSVDVDKVKDADVELIYAGDESGGRGGNPFAKPEVTVFNRGRIRGATLVAFPAFVEAKLHFTGALADGASDETETVEMAKKQDCGCGGKKLTDDGETELFVAAATPTGEDEHVITIPNVPPAAWFAEPTDVEAGGALTITDEGRVFGIVAPAGVTHRSVKTRVPTNLDFSRFHKAETIVRGGERVVTGVITADCGHAPTDNYGTLQKRREHYDNSCSVLANVRVGYSRNGNIWAAGALNPGATAEQVAQALGCTLSLDVQPHPDRPGVREFIAAHLVPVPGFPLARSNPSVSFSDGVLSAAAIPVEFTDAPRPAHVDASVMLELVTRNKALAARCLGIDAATRKRELALALSLEEFHKGDSEAHRLSHGRRGKVGKVKNFASFKNLSVVEKVKYLHSSNSSDYIKWSESDLGKLMREVENLYDDDALDPKEYGSITDEIEDAIQQLPANV